MKTSLLAAALLIAALPALAENPPEPALIACWYDQSGKFTGSTPAEAGATAGTTIQTAASGARTWRHTILGGNAGSCPDKLPVSSAVAP
jgi:hypothetical protein